MSRAASQLISVGGERGGNVGKLERDGCGEVTWTNSPWTGAGMKRWTMEERAEKRQKEERKVM